jgi:hypothetical protein
MNILIISLSSAIERRDFQQMQIHQIMQISVRRQVGLALLYHPDKIEH